MSIESVFILLFGLLAGGALVYVAQRHIAGTKVKEAEELAGKILEEARKEAQVQKKEFLLQAQDEIFRRKKEQ